MKSRWSDDEAARFVERYAPVWGGDLALRTYTSRLLGAEPTLVLHGGGNTSVKGSGKNVVGDRLEVIFVKASGFDMAAIEPDGHPGVDLAYLRRLRVLPDLTDEAMVNELRAHLFDADAPTPSIETLVHALLPPKFIDHTHADAILALTNQDDGNRRIREALGDGVIVLDYVYPGFQLAGASAKAFEANPDARAMVWMRHGIVTWGDTAREAYETMIEMVTRAEERLAREAAGSSAPSAARAARAAPATSEEEARQRWRVAAPMLRGILAVQSDDDDRPHRPGIVVPLLDEGTRRIVDSTQGREVAVSPPLTADHLIRTKPLPLWIDAPPWDDPVSLRERLVAAVEEYRGDYAAYCARHATHAEPGIVALDPDPRVILLPGMGCACAGPDDIAAGIARDITAHTLAVKQRIRDTEGTYRGLEEEHLFAMEYRPMQHAKLGRGGPPLAGRIAVVTGAAGAIGSGICRGLLESGACVAVTDLEGEHLDSLVRDLRERFGTRVLGVPLDVTDRGSVATAFDEVVARWGGVDLVIPNAGVAHVSSLAEMDLDTFRKLEQVNVEGTLLVLAEAGRLFEEQGIGGDVVVVSTKNVFAPGAKFGAYSATKAASHQLARIASLELAPLGVRVNMVSPDAVFSEGDRRSGLWETVGPDRMKARGLDREELEEFYRKRNLLKARVTAAHVANAVLFFATRQTPTTGATIPVDGGLPDATPR